MRSGSSSSSSRFKIRPKQVNASTCDFDRRCLQSGDNTGTHLHTGTGRYSDQLGTARRSTCAGVRSTRATTPGHTYTLEPGGIRPNGARRAFQNAPDLLPEYEATVG